MATITSANSKVVIVVPAVFPTPQQIQGYAADDAFTQEAFDLAETRMGVDAILSGGYVPSIKRLTIALMPDSTALDTFTIWKGAIEAAKEQFPDGSAINIEMPSISKTFIMNKVFFKNSSGMPSAKKVLEPFIAIVEYQDLIVLPT